MSFQFDPANISAASKSQVQGVIGDFAAITAVVILTMVTIPLRAAQEHCLHCCFLVGRPWKASKACGKTAFEVEVGRVQMASPLLRVDRGT